MRRADDRTPWGVHTSAVLGGCGALIGWSVWAENGVGLAMGVAATTAALAAGAARRQSRPAAATPEGQEVRAGWHELQRELDRSRRHVRPFVLIRLPKVRPDGHFEVAVRALLRSADSLWWSDGDIYVLLPETDRAMGASFLDRVAATRQGLLPQQTTIVAFPEDGVTGGALVALLRGRDVARHSVPVAVRPEPAQRT